MGAPPGTRAPHPDRVYKNVLRVARTIADLAGEENVSATHLSEAIQYRRLARSL